MANDFEGWEEVASKLRKKADEETQRGKVAWLNAGQRESVWAIADRICNNGVIIADEVGMGKTRIAVAAISAVVEAGGRVAIVVPPGLGFQWHEELRAGKVNDVPPILRSYWSYLKAWESPDLQTQQPWFKQSVIVVSQAFANWRLSKQSDKWRRALLPEVYAQWHSQRKRGGRLPRYYRGNEELGDPWIKNAAESIVKSVLCTTKHPGRAVLNKLLKDFKWTKELVDDYERGSLKRELLEQTVGLGLGVFDLVVIDEAHKSRGTDSGLSRLLKSVINAGLDIDSAGMNMDPRRICMTATPIELDVSQWSDPLKRIGLEDTAIGELKATVETYAEAVRKLRQSWRNNSETQTCYVQAARSFESALRSYVLRRDKREDEHVQEFHRISGPFAHYRHQKETKVDINSLDPGWKAAVCGAEALSLVSKRRQDPETQRLRLTLGNGHGISAFLDETQKVAGVDPSNNEFEAEATSDDKRKQRVAWWHQVVRQGFGSKANELFDHPVIRQAVKTIESYTSNGEKVLVFGRFTKPMRALTDLLNAREMLRRIHQKEPWPQQKVHVGRIDSADESEWPAVRAAWEQLRNEANQLQLPELDVAELDRQLETQYQRVERARNKFRESLIKRLDEGLREIEGTSESQYRTAYEALCRNNSISDNQDLAVVARALAELTVGANQTSMDIVSSSDLANTFCELIDSAMDRDDPDVDEDGDGKIDDAEADNFWENLLGRINEEYGRNQSGFARFMYGQTKPSSRRLMQQAFNRAECFPMVLVAQSMVGREGLNLHKACKTVVLLHPEWNPGVVEQQIGRVDRVKSHWCKKLDEAVEHGVTAGNCPRIEVIPIIFQGTYDEYNWQVLLERWDDLRAQLHGIAIPRRLAEADKEGLSILEELQKSAPRFSPLTLNALSADA